jgi:hypothetical protein
VRQGRAGGVGGAAPRLRRGAGEPVRGGRPRSRWASTRPARPRRPCWRGSSPARRRRAPGAPLRPRGEPAHGRGRLARLRYAPPWSPERKRNERFLAELDRWLAGAPAEGGGGVRLQPLAVERKEAAPDRRGPRRSFEFTFPQGMLWGLLACAANFAVGLVRERSSGTMGRLLTAPITRRQLLLGKAVGCFVAMVAVEAVLVAVGVLGFGVRPTSWPLLAAAVSRRRLRLHRDHDGPRRARPHRAVGERRRVGDAPRPRPPRRRDGAAVRHARRGC